MALIGKGTDDMGAMRRGRTGLAELRSARNAGWRLLIAVGTFSFAVNLLMLTGPLFMLQVYDRVLGSRSVETLTALFLLVVALFLLMAVLDMTRNRVMNRISARFQTRLQARVFDAALREGAEMGSSAALQGGLRDLDAIQRVLASPVCLALFDLPYAPLFMLAVFILHPLMGLVALAGGAILVVMALANQQLSRRRLTRSMEEAARADRIADLYRDEGEVIGALGMRGATFRHWLTARNDAMGTSLAATDITTGFSSFSKAFRLLLQSAILATGAWLALIGKVTPGAMIAGSILMGRALAPVDQIVGGWPQMQRAIDGWRRLGGLLERRPPVAPRTALPRPEGRLDASGLIVMPPGSRTPILRGVSFSLPAGAALGVIGPSGAGKSTLARAVIGAWPPSAGEIRLGGATLDQYDPDVLGGLIGYLPQRVGLFDGTIADNIARLAPQADPMRVVAAAQAAAAHQMILNLPQGYDTEISQIGGQLSGGQIQRIGLARALYGMPVLLVLDEPNSNLDNEGSTALNKAIRATKARGGTVMIMAHRPAAIAECDYLLVLGDGAQQRFGPRDEILQSTVRNAGAIARAAGQSKGVA